MPFFDANKMVITIDYDDNMCIVGGSLRGVVNIFVRETVTLCGASLRYRILEGCSLGGGSNPDCYNVEYVLFGARSTKQAKPVRVIRGHYSYPFAIPIPMYAPPTQRFGGESDSLVSALFGRDIAPSMGSAGPSVRVEHLVEVVVYVALSWKDKHLSQHAPCVVSCTSPSMLMAPNNGMEGHIRNGNSVLPPGKGFWSKLFNSGPSKTKEQADADLFVYNTAVSLADSPFLHFAIRGKSNCPYRIELVRVVQYTHPEKQSSTEGSPSQTDSSAANPSSGQSPESHAAPQKRTVVHEQVVSTTTMPPLDSPVQGVRGRLLISPFGLQHSVSFQGRSVSVSYYVTMALQYLTNKQAAMISPEFRMRIPVNIYHGTFEEAVAGVVDGYMAGQFAPATGAVMGYDAPPLGEAALFRPAAPVTDSGVSNTQWADPSQEPVLMRPNNQQQQQQPLQASRHAPRPNTATATTGYTTNTSSETLKCSPSPLPPASNANAQSQQTQSTVNTREGGRPANLQSAAAAQPKATENEDFAPIAPDAGDAAAAAVQRHSAYRRMYEHVAPTWVRAERQSPTEPISDFPATAEGSDAAAPSESGESVTLC